MFHGKPLQHFKPGSDLMRLVCWEDLCSRSMAREAEGYAGDGKTSDEAIVVIQGRTKRGGVDREIH